MAANVEAVRATAHAEWPTAIKAWQRLAQLNPSNLEYRLKIIDTEINAGSTTDAHTALLALRELPHAAQDPRAELAAGRLAAARDDVKGSEQHAGNALRLAQQRDAVGLVADAQRAIGAAEVLLNRNEDARARFISAIDAYREIRNPRGEAATRALLAHALGNLDRNQEAREEYQRAMTLDLQHSVATHP